MKENSIKKNYTALTKAIHHLGELYDNVFIPLRPSYLYDLIFEKENVLFKVKVIFTNTKSPNGVYVATLRKCGKNVMGKLTFAPFDSNTCEYIYVSTPKKNYLIPTNEMKNTRSISMCMFEKFIIVPS